MSDTEQVEPDLARRLAEVAVLLKAQRSPQGIRDAATRALEAARLWAGFYEPAQGGLVPLMLSSPASAPLVDTALALDALVKGRPVLSGPGEDGSGAARVAYLPLRGPSGQEVLVLAGELPPRSEGVLGLFAEHLSHFHSCVQRIAALESQQRDLRLLLDMNRAVQTLEEASILDAVADGVVRLLEATHTFILLRDRSGTLRPHAASALIRQDFPADIIFQPGGGSVTGRVARDRAPVVIPDVTRVPEDDYSVASAKRFGVRALLGVPIISRKELLGVLLVSDRNPRQFPPHQIELAQAVASQMALSIANARLYESLRQSYLLLQESLAAKKRNERLASLGELSAVVAHEVRNPLGVIFNAVSSLRSLMPPGEAHPLLDMLAEESNRLDHLVSQLLDFGRPRALSIQAEDVLHVIQDALESAALASIAGTGVSLSMEVEPDLPPVPMDRRQMHQALVNVAVNACQSMPDGGTFRVTARRDDTCPGGPWLRVDLSDDGPGISEDVLPRLFEPFFTTRATGTGLGLAVVKRIVEDHDGSVEVQSRVSRGTMFTFRLPMHR